ncbi:hypothetical protein ABIB35_000588 [Arthrobacter sp. UYP6]|uniref:hypothetical protein n=1 Tax=Arthrobacter sp. UYP6 TaxID=1756378 RepID=UPI0033947D5C
MSTRQLGVARGQESDPDEAQRLGWVDRFRKLPGFRTAAVAFALTIGLGIGGTAAYAYWNQLTPVSITGQAMQPSIPIPADVRCQSAFINRIEWPNAAGIDPEARYIVTFDSKLLDNPVTYALPRGALRIEPYYLDLKDELGYSFREYPVTVTVQTAILKNPSTATVRIAPSDLLFSSERSTPVMMGYQNLGIAGFPCRS